MKGDAECEDHTCEYLRYCVWHPNECYGKPWKVKEMLAPHTYILSTVNFITPEGKVIHRDIMQEVVDVNGNYYCVIYKRMSKQQQELMDILQTQFVEYLVEPEAKACTRC